MLDRSEVDAYREERKKLKKLHKERERSEEKRHKKKYKCYDDTCKHRKHKKRRKHKKHHHKEDEEKRSSPIADGHISPDDSVSQNGNYAEETNVESIVVKEVIRDEIEEDNGSTITESSGSLYVSPYRINQRSVEF